MARVDVALADQVKRYASLHRQPLSVVLRDALTLLMDEYPSGADLTAPHRVAAHEFLSDRYESPLDTLVGETDSVGFDELLSDTNKAAIDLLASDTNSDREYASDTNEEEEIMSDANRDTETLSDTKEAPAYIASDTKEDDSDFNPTTHSLGKLCPRKHNYRGTGHSVLRISNRHCRACDREKFHERKQAQRQAGRA